MCRHTDASRRRRVLSGGPATLHSCTKQCHGLAVYQHSISDLSRFFKSQTRRMQAPDSVQNRSVQAVSSLIYAAARVTDLQELGAIRSLLAAKFGKEYAAEAASDHLCRKWHVNDNLIRRSGGKAPPSL